MKKFIEKITVVSIYLFSFCVLVELAVNYAAFYFLFPIKNQASFGYITRKSKKTIVPLNKYTTRMQAQLALPIEIVIAISNDKNLKKDFNKLLKKFGYKDNKGQVAISYKYESANEFSGDFAIVAIEIDGKRKYGTIDKHGNWVIDPKYDYLCPITKYYTRACIDEKHCGVVDRYGNEITLMTYKTDRLNSKGTYSPRLCTLGEKLENSSCNNFL